MLTNRIYKYWGKAFEDSYHLLVYHCLDVAAVGKVWLDQSPAFVKRAAKASGLSGIAFTEWFVFFLALHDIGKFDIRFQGKVEKVIKELQTGIEYKPRICKDYNHGESGWALGVTEQNDWFSIDSEAFENWLRVVAGHHGKVPQKSHIAVSPRTNPLIIQNDKQSRIQFSKTVKKLLAPNQSFDDLPKHPSKLLAGFCSICDWIGSNHDYFHPKSSFDGSKKVLENCQDYYVSRFDIAKRALTEFGVLPLVSSTGGMGKLFPNYIPQGVQTIVEQLPLDQSLTIIEAPTGSGKTEAALSYASLLLANGMVDAITFALPTQATSNAMFSRMEKVAQKLFDGETNLILAHGKSRFNESFLNIKNKNQTSSDEDCFVQCSNWLASSKKRSFLGQIGVSTIDQVLLSVLPVRHYFVRSFGIGRSVLIIDEVHAYDNYMYGLLEEVIREQKKLGGSIILLSATLPINQKDKLQQAWGIEIDESEDPRNAPYPLITSSLLKKPITVDKKEKPKPFNVEVNLSYSDKLAFTDLLITEIIKAAESGASVCVICNIVADAQALSMKISELISDEIEVDIFHSRYRFKDRKDKETAVLNKYGKKGERKGRILVATQVVEQSLDIDFDWMVTQICPADLLFQRLGRLHRHTHWRPKELEQRKITVVLPETELEYGGTGIVYANTLALWKTQKLLEASPILSFPSVYRVWVENVYDGDDSKASEDLKRLNIEFEGSQLARHKNARLLSNCRNTLGQPFDDIVEQANSLTRDGEMSLSVIPMLNDDTLLDGTKLSLLREWEKWEALSMNAVPVPSSRSWKDSFTYLEDDYMKIELNDCGNGIYVTKINKYQFTYTAERGLERIEI